MEVEKKFKVFAVRLQPFNFMACRLTIHHQQQVKKKKRINIDFDFFLFFLANSYLTILEVTQKLTMQ